MRDFRREPYKQRISTRDRFVSFLRGEKEEDSKLPWYRERRNYLPLLAIFMFILMLYVTRMLHENNFLLDKPEVEMVEPIQAPTLMPTETTNSDKPMDYDEAKRLLGE